jgi:hypothetical protein
MIHRAVILGLLLIVFLSENCNAQNQKIYISPDGHSMAKGSLSDPVNSLHRAAELVKEHAGQLPVTVYLSGGNYPLNEALKLGPEHSGTQGAPVLWKALPGEDVRVSGGIPVENWVLEEDGSWSAELPENCPDNFRSLYMNGKRATRARHPNKGYLRVAEAGADKRTNFYFNKVDIPELDKPEYLELILLHDWSITRIQVKSIDRKSRQLTAVDSIGSRLNFFTLTHWEENPRYFLENAREFCDQQGEWYADFKAHKIFYHPLPGEKIVDAQGIIPVARKLLLIEGNSQHHTSHIRFEGITFEHSAWAIPESGYCGIQACMHTDRTKTEDSWSKVPAAIELHLATSCNFDQCTIRHTGGSGIWIGSNCSACSIEASHIYDISGNGVSIGEGQDRISSGETWWKAHPEEVSRGNRVSHSLIEHCGQEFFGAVGIWCGLVANTVIEHNEIRQLPYTGISIGWMWTAEATPCRENTIHGNHIHHILNILSDGGGIYSLGLQPGSRITQNLIHDIRVNAGRAESNGMFLDEGTKELLVEGNIIYSIARSPLRFHKAQHPNTVRNNVLVCNKRIPPIRYNNTKEEDILKIDNIILSQSSRSDMVYLEELIKERMPVVKKD